MLRQIALAGLVLTCCLYSSGQEFEVASIKPSPEKIDTSSGPVFFGSKGGPGTEDPVRYSCNFCDISDLVSMAYDVPDYRIVGTKPLTANRFSVVATIPVGATRDEFRRMLQNLLAERFGLKVHREVRQMNTYRLLVSRGGVKLKPNVDGVPTEAKSRGEKPQVGYHYKAQATMADFARVVEGRIRQPVVNDTGLTGKYDFDLSWSFDDLDTDEKSPSDLPTLRSAMELVGLRLESHKEQVEVIVIDDVAKSPISN